MNLAELVLSGNRLALAKVITRVENDDPEGFRVLDELFPHTGRAHLIGITGAPGTGKSSLVNQLALTFRKTHNNQSKTVAIVAIDPSSPFTGGALLGDRVRMRDLSGDPGIFIRSMASRGSVGGLARTTAAVVQVLDAAGFDVIIIETVGAGQSEVDIARLAHTTIVIEAPGLGDDIQANKAGILEIADILVVNKADQPNAENTYRVLRSSFELAHHPDDKNISLKWFPPILLTTAPQGIGIEELYDQIIAHRTYLVDSGNWQVKEKNRLSSEFEDILKLELIRRWRESVSDATLNDLLNQLFDRRLSPTRIVSMLLK